MLRIRPASVEDAGEILTVQRAAFVAEGQLYDRFDLPPMTESLAEVVAAIEDPAVRFLVAELDGPRGPRVVGSARLGIDGPIGYVGRIAAAPDLAGTGIGSALLTAAEQLAGQAQPPVTDLELVTGARSAGNIEWYQRRGYGLVGEDSEHAGITVVVLRKSLSGDRPPAAG